MTELTKTFPVGDKKFSIIKMDPFSAIHFQLRIMEILAKHEVNVSGSLLEAAGRLFTVLNREDHDEILFELLTKSRAQCIDNGMFISSYGELNATFSVDNVADVYMVALECVKFSIAPVAEGLKKNIGLDVGVNLQGNIQGLLKGFLSNLTKPSGIASHSGE